MIRRKLLESILFLLVFIYIGRVMVVLVYMDAKGYHVEGGPHSKGEEVPEMKRPKKLTRDVLEELSRNDAEKSLGKREEKPGKVEDHLHDSEEKQEQKERESELLNEHKNDKPAEEEKVDSKEDDLHMFAETRNGQFFPQVLKQVFDHTETCHRTNPFVVALISSTPEAKEFRAAIRETWANVPDAEHMGVVTMFILGQPKEPDDALEQAIFQENEKHDDILQGNFIDNSRNGTLKLLLGLRFLTKSCSSAKFVYQGDDHTLVNFERLIRILRNLNEKDTKKTWRGLVNSHNKPDRNPKSRYFVPKELYNGPIFPPFCTNDAGSVMTIDTAHEIVHEAWETPVLPFSDIFMGVIGKKNLWKLVHDDKFSYKDYRADACGLQNFITSRGFGSPDLYFDSWEKLKNETFLRNCPEPDLDLVLNSNSNEEYLDKTLQLVHDHPETCFSDGQEEEVFMVVLISSLTRNFEARRAIRDTWGSQNIVQGRVLKFVFVMGTTQKNTEEIQKKIQVENEQYGDIVQAEFLESFQNLTLKVVLGLKWVTNNCKHAKYMYKGDDDMFVNWDNIIGYIEKEIEKGKGKNKLFLGSVLYRSVRVTRRESKYYVPDHVYSGRYFPPYCSGGGYIISTDIIPAMYEKSLTTAFIPIDDAYQGILAKKIGVMPTDNKGFKNWGEKSDTCSLRNPNLMTIHGYKDPLKMYGVWKNFTDEAVDCKR